MSACHQPPWRSHSACGVNAGDAAGHDAAEHPASVKIPSSSIADKRVMTAPFQSHRGVQGACWRRVR